MRSKNKPKIFAFFFPSSLAIHPPITEIHKRKLISGTRSGEEDALLAASCYAWLELDGHTWPSKQALFIHLLPHSAAFLSPPLPPTLSAGSLPGQGGEETPVLGGAGSA